MMAALLCSSASPLPGQQMALHPVQETVLQKALAQDTLYSFNIITRGGALQSVRIADSSATAITT